MIYIIFFAISTEQECRSTSVCKKNDNELRNNSLAKEDKTVSVSCNNDDFGENISNGLNNLNNSCHEGTQKSEVTEDLKDNKVKNESITYQQHNELYNQNKNDFQNDNNG